MPQVLHLLSRHELPNPIDVNGLGNNAADFTRVLVNGALSVVLVLTGGFFAGLTLALMGQDEITLRVLASSGRGRQKLDAQRVLSLLQRGKHWVLVTLLLGNVIVNEALPVILDSEMKGGWLAVVVSTGLVVSFGEIIPQSICARYGLAIGARSSTLVVCLMYLLSPIGYPIARLLDHILGTYHDRTFSRAGLKTLIMLHEIPRSPFNNPERLYPSEVSALCNILSNSTIAVSQLMIPAKNIFTLSSTAHLNEILVHNILKSGLNMIPVHDPANIDIFIGLLNVRTLIGLDFNHRDIMITELELEEIRSLAPGTKLIEAVESFRGLELMMINEDARTDNEALGFVVYRDLMESCALGQEMAMC